jgi:hypothetical protein
LSSKTKEGDIKELELNYHAPRRVTTHNTAIVETSVVKNFHPEPKYGEGTHNGAPKRVTTSAGIATELALAPKCITFA